MVTSDPVLWELVRRGLRGAAGRRFALTIHGRKHQVHVTAPDGLTYQVLVDGQPVAVQLVPLGKATADASAASGTLFRVGVGGRWLRMEVSRDAKGTPQLLVDGKAVSIALGPPGALVASRAPSPGRAARAQHSGHGPATQPDKRVMAVMPGRIVAITITPGQRVDEGQELCVLEAMKMEQIIRAPAAGVVRQTLIRPGQTVNAGDLLVELE